MKTKQTNKSGLPPIMSQGSVKFSGTDRHKIIANQLKNCYAADENPLPIDDDLFEEAISDLYRDSYSDANAGYWVNYDNSFDEKELFDAIHSLKIRKNAGPMGIQAKTVKEHHQRLLLPILSTFNIALNRGRIPAEWKQTYNVPIPEKGIRWTSLTTVTINAAETTR